MDKITKCTLQQLAQLEKELKQCERRLTHLGHARVPVYFDMPRTARDGFAQIYHALEVMRAILQQKPPRLEG